MFIILKSLPINLSILAKISKSELKNLYPMKLKLLQSLPNETITLQIKSLPTKVQILLYISRKSDRLANSLYSPSYTDKE